MNIQSFQKFLATGEFAPTMDSNDNKGAEFGENWKLLEPGMPLWDSVKSIVTDCQLQPDEELRADSLRLGGIWLSNDAKAEAGTPEMNPHYVVELFGGTNGSQDKRVFLAYLAVVRKFAKKMLDDKVAEEIWLVDWKNDCADDVWTVRLGFKTSEQVDSRVKAEDSGIDWKADPGVQETLETHDRRFHPNGYKEGDKCKFRERLEKGDLADHFLDDIKFDAEAEEKAEQDRKNGIDYVKLSAHINKMLATDIDKLRESVPGYSAENTWSAVANCGGVGKTPVPYGLVSVSGYCGTKEQFNKKVAMAKRNAEAAAAYLTSKTGNPWRIYAKELYDKEDNLLDEKANWKDIHDVTFLISGDTIKVMPAS